MQESDKLSDKQEFEKLWEKPQEESFNDTLTEKVFSLEDDTNKYILVNKDDKTETVEATSVEEALSKAIIKDVVKVFHTCEGGNCTIIDNNLLKSEKTT